MNLEQELVAKERAALDRWIRGDTDGFLDLCDPEMTYFDTNAEHRIDGTAAFKKHLAMYSEGIRAMLKARGKTQMDNHEIVNPKLQRTGDMAVLSYEWVARIDTDVIRWRASNVYRLKEEMWRMIHGHWSAVQPPAN